MEPTHTRGSPRQVGTVVLRQEGGKGLQPQVLRVVPTLDHLSLLSIQPEERVLSQKMIPSVNHRDYVVTQLSKALARFNTLETGSCHDLGPRSREVSAFQPAPAMDIIIPGTPHTWQRRVKPPQG